MTFRITNDVIGKQKQVKNRCKFRVLQLQRHAISDQNVKS